MMNMKAIQTFEVINSVYKTPSEKLNLQRQPYYPEQPGLD